MTVEQQFQYLIDNMVTKKDMEEFKQSVETNMQSMKMELYDEIVRAEKNIDSNSEMLKSLNNKYDTLLLKTDNTDLLFRLINKQANEVDELKARLDIVEKKIS